MRVPGSTTATKVVFVNLLVSQNGCCLSQLIGSGSGSLNDCLGAADAQSASNESPGSFEQKLVK